jgi:hypothetical protein
MLNDLQIERLAEELATTLGYPWEFMPSKGRDDFRSKARKLAITAYSTALEHCAQTEYEPNATQWWLAELDQYGNPNLSDGAHGGRDGAEQAYSLMNALNLSKGKRFAVARVSLFDPVGNADGINQEAVATINAARNAVSKGGKS